MLQHQEHPDYNLFGETVKEELDESEDEQEILNNPNSQPQKPIKGAQPELPILKYENEIRFEFFIFYT